MRPRRQYRPRLRSGGVLVSDCLSSYDPPAYAKHKCIAHHQKAIGAALRGPQTKDPAYLGQWRQFFRVVSIIWKCRGVLPPLAWETARGNLRAERDRLLALPVAQPGDVRVRHRLLKQQPFLLGCLEHDGVEPTNNRAERALRPAVVARKVSCGNKTERGRLSFETLTSVAATCWQQGKDFVSLIVARLRPQPAQKPIG